MNDESKAAADPGRPLVSSGNAEEQLSRTHAAQPSQGFQPLPKPSGKAPYRLSLEEAVGGVEAERLQGAEQIVFHVVGDSGGVKYPVSQQLVADYMGRDFAARDPAPAFCYHLGDVVYYNGERSQYYPQFYEPYRDYPAPIVAIPGNHDGDPLDAKAEPSLEAFVRTFCATSPKVEPEAGDAPRTTMVQPNAYWTLTADLFTVIGLYSNVPEGGEIAEDQVAWLVGELEAAPEKALIVALHHPPYSADAHHGGSARMGTLLDEAFAKAKRIPDLAMSGHVHNYQRFTRSFQQREIPYLVVGASGYWHLHYMANAADGSELKTPWDVPDSDVVLEAYADSRHGFLRLAVSEKTIAGEYTTVPRPQESWTKGPVEVIDTFALDLAEHKVATRKQAAK
jgi:acid phosphatase type 7